MEINALSLIQRHDGSYFYLVELGYIKGLYKYIICNWNKSKLDKPILIYSHTKRSKLTLPLKEFFDNNLLNTERLKKYREKNNTYIGGIDKVNNVTVREFKEGVVIPTKYKIYEREGNYILIENIGFLNNLNIYMIYEFSVVGEEMKFFESKIYSETDLLNLTDEDQDFVINNLLSKERVAKKVKNNYGYVGTVENINGVLRRKTYTDKELKLKEVIDK